MPPKTKIGVQLLTATQAADLLNVHVRTIHAWIEQGTIPYISLPSQGKKPSYRIPLHGLLNSLSGNYDLAAELDQLYQEPATPQALNATPS